MLAWVAHELRRFDAPWFVAGGWALALFADSTWRPHHDVDVAIFRKDQHRLAPALPGSNFVKIEEASEVRWDVEEYLQPPIHEIHVTSNGKRLEFLLNECEDDVWRYRRRPEIARPASSIGAVSREGIPYLVPEIVLLYKAKHARSVDHMDFERVAPSISPEGRRWLISALYLCHPNHAWISGLESHAA